MSKNVVLHDARFIAVDLEGNGANPPEIVEIALVPFTLASKDVPFQSLVRPHEPISPLVQRKHGITNDAVRRAPRFDELANTVRWHLEGRVLVAHRATVEVTLLSRMLNNWAPAVVIDTYPLSRRVLPGLASYSLVATADELGLRPVGRLHRALSDADLTADLLIALIGRSDVATLGELQDLARSGGARVYTPRTRNASSKPSSQLSFDEPPPSTGL